MKNLSVYSEYSVQKNYIFRKKNHFFSNMYHDLIQPPPNFALRN